VIVIVEYQDQSDTQQVSMYLHECYIIQQLMFFPYRTKSRLAQCVRFEVHTARSMKMTVFWDVAQCSLILADVSERRTAAIITLIVYAFTYL
jgi:hypothetical protein